MLIIASRPEQGEVMERGGKPDSRKGSVCNCTAWRKASRRISQLYDAALAPGAIKTMQREILAEADG